MLNRVILQGRMVVDPELRQTPSGVAVCTFRIAVDRDFKNKDGEREADFINVMAWRSTAEFISRNFSKGKMIVLDGRIQVRSYTDRDGNKRTVSEVVAENVYFGERKDPLNDLVNTMCGTTYAPGGTDVQFSEISEDDGKLPF